MTYGLNGRKLARGLYLDLMLSAGKRVLVVTPEGRFLKRRVEHLTLIERIEDSGYSGDEPSLIFVDELA